MRSVDDILAHVETIQRRLLDAKNLRILSQYPEWTNLARSLESQMAGKVNEICALDCTHERAIGIRASLQTLRWFLAVVKIPDDRFEAMAKEHADLRAAVIRLHTIGQISQSDYERFVETADRIKREIEAST